jgi:hypothetical protein
MRKSRKINHFKNWPLESVPLPMALHFRLIDGRRAIGTI